MTLPPRPSSPDRRSDCPDGVCPFSRTPSMRECVFAEGLDSLGTMIIVLDMVKRQILFENKLAGRFLDEVKAHSFESLSNLLNPHGSGLGAQAHDHPGGNSFRHGSLIYGYSLYRSGNLLWIMLRDITEKVRLESIAEAVAQMDSLGFIFSAVRHELGNPIHSIKSAVGFLRSHLDSIPKGTVADYLGDIETELGRAESLLRSLKNFSMFERPEIKPLDLASFFKQFSPLIKPDCQAKGIGIEVKAADHLPMVGADSRALHQILINLVANAVDAVAGQPEPYIRIQAHAGYGEVFISVDDNGAGIPGDLLPQLFTPFFTTKGHGTGLGLVIVKKMVTGMDGVIWVEPLKPRGTRFCFSLRSL